MIFKFRWKPDDATAFQLTKIQSKLSLLEENIMTLNETVAALATKVSEQGTIVESAIALLNGLAANQGNPAAVQAILDQVNLQNTALSGAVTANTPAP
jgi:hypothetical protein